MIRNLTGCVVNLQGALAAKFDYIGSKVDHMGAKVDSLIERVSKVEDVLGSSLDDGPQRTSMSPIPYSPAAAAFPFGLASPLFVSPTPTVVMENSSQVSNNPLQLSTWKGFVVSTFYVQWYKAGMWNTTSATYVVTAFSKIAARFMDKLNYFLDADHPLESHCQSITTISLSIDNYMRLLSKV